MKSFRKLQTRKLFSKNLNDKQRIGVRKCFNMITIEGILNDMVESVKSETKIYYKLMRLVIEVSAFLLRNNMLDYGNDLSVLHHPRFLDGLGNHIFQTFLEFDDFNPFFFSWDLEDYIFKHPRMAEYSSVLSPITGMERKQVFQRFLNNNLLKIYPLISVFSKKIQHNKIERLLVHEFESLIEEFNKDVSNIGILHENIHQNYISKYKADNFFRHLYTYHSLKLFIKYEPEKFDEKLNKNTIVFEETLKMIISKVNLIQSMTHLGLKYDPVWSGTIMDTIANINHALPRGRNFRKRFGLNSLIKLVSKKYDDQAILNMWPIWRDELIKARNAVEDQNQRYIDYMASIGTGEEHSIEYKWKNSNIIKGMKMEFEFSVRPEVKVVEVISAMDDFFINIKNLLEARKPPHFFL
ncbi:hypothetical protein PPACK8108_LOCUS21633 [Phakopsora pachyrhizi]|uniref:Uncharacterized protein n=1 Tax=Phakopsora pachyrhizi TaxID=170000 RepID=A0AAV0BK19_PHAPC|nr:hypothetical protein PPACK8108_LOCUS21633 [Phakopsora pachyrhizi]